MCVWCLDFLVCHFRCYLHLQDMHCKINELFKLFNRFVQSTPQTTQTTHQGPEKAKSPAGDGGLLVRQSKSSLRRLQPEKSPVLAKLREGAVEMFDPCASTIQDQQDSKAAIDVS